MNVHASDLAGWTASAFTLATFVCCQSRALRLCALAANASFIVYGLTAQLWPVLALHVILVPINLWRLSQLLGAAPAGRVAPNGRQAPALVQTPSMRMPMIRAHRDSRFTGCKPIQPPGGHHDPSFPRHSSPARALRRTPRARCIARTSGMRWRRFRRRRLGSDAAHQCRRLGAAEQRRRTAHRDPSVRTHQQLDATRAQAAALEAALQGEVLEVRIDCCGAEMAERAVNIASDIQAARDFSDDVPVLVKSSDLRTAAGVVDRLAADGMTRVWLVTQ